MSKPRFRVTSLAGFSNRGKQPVVDWYVLDSAVCYHVVRRFAGRGLNRAWAHTAEYRARAYADRLNHDHP